MAYQPMPPAPQGGPPPRGKDPRTAPSTVRGAVGIMIVIAVLALIGLIVVIADKGALRTAIEKANRSFDSSQIDSAVNTAVTVAVVIGLILIVLFLLLARQVRKGKNWARIVTWVVAGLGVLGNLSNLAQPETATSKSLAGVELVLYIVLIVLLALRASNEYFRKPVYGYGYGPY